MFLIPFDAFIQAKSPESRRGQIIAASNFLSFFGVLIASLFLFIIGDVFKLSASIGFTIIGVIALAFNFINTGRLSDEFFPYFVTKFLKHLYRIELQNTLPKGSVFLIKKINWPLAFVLFAKIENMKIITSGKKFRNFPFYNGFSNTTTMISKKKFSLNELKLKTEMIKEKDCTLCLMLKNKITSTDVKKAFKGKENLFILKTDKYHKYKKFMGLKLKKTIFKPHFEKMP